MRAGLAVAAVMACAGVASAQTVSWDVGAGGPYIRYTEAGYDGSQAGTSWDLSTVAGSYAEVVDAGDDYTPTIWTAAKSGETWSLTFSRGGYNVALSGGDSGGGEPGGGEEVLIEDIGLDAPGFLLAVATNFGVVVSACLSLSFGLLVINKGVRWYASTIRKA